MVNQEHRQFEASPKMGRRTLRIVAGFLPALMSRGVHHYFVGGEPLPDDCRIVDASMSFRETPGAQELVLLLESEEWEPIAGVPAPEVRLSFVEPIAHNRGVSPEHSDRRSER